MKTDLEYTLSSHRLPALVVPRTVEEELTWLFCAFRRRRSPVSAHRDHRYRVMAIGAKRRLSLGVLSGGLFLCS